MPRLIRKNFGKMVDGQFVPDNPKRRAAAIKKLEGSFCWETYEKHFDQRTLPQNRYYYGVVVDILAKEFGYTKDECNEALRGLFLRIPGENGKPDRILHTRDLDTADFNEYLENIRRWALIEFQIYIPEPNEVAIAGGN